jgi:hypothetical protein
MRGNRRAAGLGLAVTSFLVATASGCQLLASGGPVDELYVRNHSDDEWLIRVPIPYEGYAGRFWVTRILPGADGIADKWAKQPPDDAQVEVLGADCEPVAAFWPTTTVYSVTEAPGLEVRITPWGSNTDRWNMPEIVAVEKCGGSPRFV